MSSYVSDLLPDGMPITAEATLAYETMCARLAPGLRNFAKTITDDEDNQKDLVQEAMISLWIADPARYDVRNKSEVAYLRKILIVRMWQVWGVKKKRHVHKMAQGTGPGVARTTVPS
jgi:DNA-directed RNA polymerase specialized sigma24 family protein